MTRQHTDLQPQNALLTIGVDGPLLVIATSQTVAKFAPGWAASRAGPGGGYRVLVVCETNPYEAQLIAAEATAQGAAGIVAVGSEAVLAAAADAAVRLNLPLAAIPLGSVPD